jgi:hypothetical protein
VLMATTVFPHINVVALSIWLGVALVVGLAGGAIIWSVRAARARSLGLERGVDEVDRVEWRMPPAALLERAELTGGRRLVLVAMAAYLVVAVALLLVKAIQIG